MARYVLFAGHLAPQHMPKPLDFMINPAQFKHHYSADKIAGWEICGGPVYLNNDGCVHVPSAFIFTGKARSRGPIRVLTEMGHVQLQNPYPFGKDKGKNIFLAYINNGFKFNNHWFNRHSNGGIAGKNRMYRDDYYEVPERFHAFQGVIQPILDHWHNVAALKEEVNKTVSATFKILLNEIDNSTHFIRRIPSRIRIGSNFAHTDMDVPGVSEVNKKLDQLLNRTDKIRHLTFHNLSLSMCANAINDLNNLNKELKAVINVMNQMPSRLGWKCFHVNVPFVSDFKTALHNAHKDIVDIKGKLHRLHESLYHQEKESKNENIRKMAEMMKKHDHLKWKYLTLHPKHHKPPKPPHFTLPLFRK
jgi:hypothetical protein